MKKFVVRVAAFWNSLCNCLSPELSPTGFLVTPKRKPSRAQQAGLVLILILLVGVFFAYLNYDSSGRYPFFNRPVNLLPPKMDPGGQTYEQVMSFILSDDTDRLPTQSGFNCVDATFRVWRNSVWQGLAAYPIVIQYDSPPGHMIIVFPTNDRGDVFIESQKDSEVSLRVGQNYNHRKVRGFYVLDYAPIPLAGSPAYDFNISTE